MVVAYSNVGISEEIDGMKIFLHEMVFILYHPAEKLLHEFSITIPVAAGMNYMNCLIFYRSSFTQRNSLSCFLFFIPAQHPKPLSAPYNVSVTTKP